MALDAGVAFNDDGRALSSMGVDARDIDNDGREDLFITANDERDVSAVPQSRARDCSRTSRIPAGSAARPMPSTGWSAGIFDFNNDGCKDLFAACGSIDDNVEEFSDRRSRQREPACWRTPAARISRM